MTAGRRGFAPHRLIIRMASKPPLPRSPRVRVRWVGEEELRRGAAGDAAPGQKGVCGIKVLSVLIQSWRGNLRSFFSFFLFGRNWKLFKVCGAVFMYVLRSRISHSGRPIAFSYNFESKFSRLEYRLNNKSFSSLRDGICPLLMKKSALRIETTTPRLLHRRESAPTNTQPGRIAEQWRHAWMLQS
ncbi:hypothetical protein IF1G_02505 [Cordyceps javanica]|uniref:Uncharacterized protein n=1 Tax=Cordyceps javanica TaxID=43265 RepID=A0A545V9L8_9HYPO|nr:hypothetical protein IF1G_02505 [Cordyceps javanica]